MPARPRRPARRRRPRRPDRSAAASRMGRVRSRVDRWSRQRLTVATDHDTHKARLQLLRVMSEAALVELGIEEDRPALVEHGEGLARRERVEPFEHAHHGLWRFESTKVEEE